MSKALLRAAALAAAALAPAAALAQTAAPPQGLGHVKDKPEIALDPATAYIAVRNADAASFSFIRIADEANLADYKARRAAALVKAHAKWERRHATWIKNRDAYLKDARNGRPAIRPPGPEPVEPNDANLAFTPIDVENLISFGPANRFSKSAASIYIQGVRPGRYAFYGPIMTAGNGSHAGMCMCMGTFEFEAKPGQITDIGTMILMFDVERGRARTAGTPPPRTTIDLPETVTSVSWRLPVAGDRIDPRLASYTIVPAELHAGRRVPNYLGLEIDRVMPIDGVLAYRRDKVIDVRSGATLP